MQSNIDAEALARSNADTNLQSNLVTESGTRLANDNTLQSNIDAEALARSNADTNLQSNLDAESGTRLAHDTSLQNNIDAESLARTNADKRMTFVSVGEAEGLLSVNDYPFAFGFGSPSKAGFCLAIPFNFAIVGFAVTADSTDNSRSIGFSLEHSDVNGN